MIKSEVIIIGAGPAGIAASIQLKRSGINPIIIERDRIGGLVRSANLIENYPGFPAGISGVKFANLLEKQMANNGVSPVFDEVVNIEWKGNEFISYTRNECYSAGKAIIASGTRALKLPLVSMNIGAGKYIFNDIVPLLNVKAKKIAIIGSGDAAFDYALNLARNNNVSINMRSQTPKCLPVLLERSLQNGNIILRNEYQLQSVDEQIEGIGLKWKCNEGLRIENVDLLLTAIGREPNLEFMKNITPVLLENLKKEQHLFIIGDASSGIHRQIAIAAGDGVCAAMSISEARRKN